MKRRPSELGEVTFDVLVVGAGIHGACIAREAALRGLSVAIVDRYDFGGATSANSQKVIHGGLRYLQKLNLRRVRQSVRERDLLMRLAPHLIAPMPFVIPTFGYGPRSRAGMRVAFGLCNLVAPGDPVPAGRHARKYAKRILSKRELVAIFPDLAADRAITGGALWYDGQVYNTERLALAFLRSAVELGAVAVNYIDVLHLCTEAARVSGAVAADVLGGGEFEIRARFVVSATGPWISELATQATQNEQPRELRWSKAWNIITPSVHPTHALGMSLPQAPNQMRGEKRILFQTPWRQRTIIGTLYESAPCVREPGLTDREVARAVDDANRAFPWLRLRREDVLFHHVGLLPVSAANAQRGAVANQLSDRPLVFDHEREGGLPGVVSVCGVKYTTARLVAQDVIRRVLARLGHRSAFAGIDETPVDGGDLPRFDTFEASLAAAAPAELQPAVCRLARHYGSRASELVAQCRTDPHDALPVAPGAATTRAEVRYAVREEMAVTLRDTVLRRTGLGAIGHPGEAALRGCARIMAEELGWSDQRTEKEIVGASTLYDTDGGPGVGDPPDQAVAAAPPGVRCKNGRSGAENT